MEVTIVGFNREKYKIKKSFYDWCVENDRMDLNDRFDEGKNGCTTKDISYGSGEKMWFKCPRHLHESEQHKVCVITKRSTINLICNKCNSIAQIVIDRFGEEYLWSHWHYSNKVSPWDIPHSRNNFKIIIQCTEKEHHVYQQEPYDFCRGAKCPYCTKIKVHPNDSLAVVCPDVIDIWSDKNEKSPYEYAPRSGKSVWLKCRFGKHEDHLCALNNAFRHGHLCPDCVNDDISRRMSGPGSPSWKGGVHDKDDLFRHSREYKNWRTSVYRRDNYTCQCCGLSGVELNAHHLNSFASYPELRLNINNGITLCANCHDSTKIGSLHNVYGTYNIAPDVLRQYILDKCNKDIYITNSDLLYQIPLLPNEEFEFN